MGQSQSSKTSSTPLEWTSEEVEQATGLSKVSQEDVQALNAQSPAEKRHLLSTLNKQSKMTEAEIKHIIKQAKAQAKKMPSVQEPPQELSDQAKADLAELPAEVAVVTQKKIEKVLAKKLKASKDLIRKEITRARTACGIWKANKKVNPTKPTNPLSGRPLDPTKTTYKMVEKICKTKKKSCATPGNSPSTGKPLKQGGREATLLRELCVRKVSKKN